MDRLEWNVPRSLDETPRLLLFDIHQVVLFVTLAALGIVLGSMLGGIAAGAMLAKLYGNLRSHRHPCIVKHLAYWYLPAWVLSLHGSPPGHLRVFVG